MKGKIILNLTKEQTEKLSEISKQETEGNTKKLIIKIIDIFLKSLEKSSEKKQDNTLEQEYLKKRSERKLKLEGIINKY
ncbi:TPA_asm: hypothetical protein [Altiarchaeum virus]|nr:MAG: hypothetical protein BWK75_06325 [Candidatus Altiarchaeales archaeon A3]DAZ85574.1 TPA_asm: hypothetical protein [Altiarchaeum virus]